MSKQERGIAQWSGHVTRRGFLRGIGAAACTLAAARLGLAEAVEAAPKPVRFAVLGDFGDGGESQFSIGALMAREHERVPLDMVVSAGDNIYPNGSPEDFGAKFELPFEALIRRKIPFYTCFGNHDVRRGADAQLRYPLFNMKGRSYYSTVAGGGTAEFFMLDSNDLDDRQLAWLDSALARSTAVWKVPVFHHPIYSSGKRHGSSASRRRLLEPILVRHRVPVAFSGHDHIYQRVVPQGGVQYFVTGAGGKIREGGLDPRDALCAAGFDSDSHVMLVEADERSFRFKAVSAGGQVVDSGELVRSAVAAAATR